MRRGDLYWVDLDPRRGSEANKVRPAVVVSNNAANNSAQKTQRGAITVVPVTSNTDRILPFHVLLHASECGLDKDSKAQAEQVRSVSVQRVRHRVGALPQETVRDIDNALRLHLGL